MTGHVLGLDLGLAHCGAAQLQHDGTIRTWHLHTDPLAEGASLARISARVHGVAAWALNRATTTTTLAVVEGPSHGSLYGNPHERAGIWWRVVDSLIRHEVPVAVLAPTTLKAYITGHGNATKTTVQQAVHTLWPGRGLDRVTDHEADAVALATAGAHWLEWPTVPIWTLGEKAATHLNKGQWPDRSTV